MEAAPVSYRLFVGIDIAATSFVVVCRPPGAASTSTPARTLPQTPAGFATLQQQLAASGLPASSILIVMEATGSYWMRLASSLVQAGFVVSVINPSQAHAFAKALLKRAKTDAIDAQTLAHLAAVLEPAPWTPPPAVYVELQQRLAQREAFLQIRQELRNQLHALVQQPVVVPSVRTRTEELITTLDKQMVAVEREMATVLQQDAAWAAAAARLQTITGIGLLTATWLLVTTLAFTLCPTPEAATGYAGLAANERRSGTSVHGRARIGHSGNAHLRRALYLASLSATRDNPVIKAFYERLRAAGKPAKVAQCAAARKLLHIAWAVVVKERDFDPAYASLPRSGCAA